MRRISSMANSLPMHWCVPPRNGKYSPFGRVAVCSPEQSGPGLRTVRLLPKIRMAVRHELAQENGDPRGTRKPPTSSSATTWRRTAQTGGYNRIDSSRTMPRGVHGGDSRRASASARRGTALDFVPHALAGLRMRRQQIPGPGESGGRRLVAGHEERQHLAAQLVVRHRRAGFLIPCGHQHGQQFAVIRPRGVVPGRGQDEFVQRPRAASLKRRLPGVGHHSGNVVNG